MSTKTKKEVSDNNVASKDVKIDEVSTELESVTTQYNESVRLRNYHDEMAKRCLGAMEVLQKLIGEESELVND